jgi:hypothetical protein
MNWKQYRLILMFILGATFAVSCMGLPKHPEFNVTNCTKLRQDMTIEQIESMFGKPDKILMDLCGPEGEKFSCMIYRYEMGYAVGKYNGIMNHNNLFFSKQQSITEISLDDGTTITVGDPRWRSMGFPIPLMIEGESWTLYQWFFDYAHPE